MFRPRKHCPRRAVCGGTIAVEWTAPFATDRSNAATHILPTATDRGFRAGSRMLRESGCGRTRNSDGSQVSLGPATAASSADSQSHRRCVRPDSAKVPTDGYVSSRALTDGSANHGWEHCSDPSVGTVHGTVAMVDV
uniref:Uncharacterized protein n=1 Tax=Anopheles christyi TaxID=43041 RepID=A0A182KIH1_9DIPT